jgi:hypothetical protein
VLGICYHKVKIILYDHSYAVHVVSKNMYHLFLLSVCLFIYTAGAMESPPGTVSTFDDTQPGNYQATSALQKQDSVDSINLWEEDDSNCLVKPLVDGCAAICFAIYTCICQRESHDRD